MKTELIIVENDADLWPRRTASRVSEVMSGKCRLSTSMVRRLRARSASRRIC